MQLPVHQKASKFVLSGLFELDQIRKVKELRDRSEYVGASDIAAAATGCLRRVVLDKLYPCESADTKDLVRKIRGKAFEDMVFNAIRHKIPTSVQNVAVHITSPNGSKIIVHPDIMTFTPRKLIIFEVKSFHDMPMEVWPEGDVQLNFQVSSTAIHWNEAHFTIGESDEMFTIPGLAQHLFGFTYPKQVPVEGHLTYIDGNQLYVLEECHPSEASYGIGITNAEKITQHMLSEDPFSTPRATGVYLLCDSCEHRETCSRFKCVEMEEFGELFARANLAKETFEAAKLRYDYEKSVLENLLKPWAGRYVYANGLQSKCSKRNGRRTVSAGRMNDALMSRNYPEEEIEAIIGESTVEGAPYYVMEIGLRKASKSSAKKKQTEQQLPKAA